MSIARERCRASSAQFTVTRWHGDTSFSTFRLARGQAGTFSLIFPACPRESKSSEITVTSVTLSPRSGYFRIKTQRLTMQKSVTYEAKVRDLRCIIHWLTNTRTKKIYEKVWATMSKYEQLWIAPHHFRIFATWFRDTRRTLSAKPTKTFDGTGSSICHAIPISKLSPTTASYSKAVTSASCPPAVPSRIIWRRPLMVRQP